MISPWWSERKRGRPLHMCCSLQHHVRHYHGITCIVEKSKNQEMNQNIKTGADGSVRTATPRSSHSLISEVCDRDND